MERVILGANLVNKAGSLLRCQSLCVKNHTIKVGRKSSAMDDPRPSDIVTASDIGSYIAIDSVKASEEARSTKLLK